MKLTLESIKNQSAWAAADIRLPQFNLAKVKANTKKRPEWVHFGAGNIFRGFIANAHQTLLDKGMADTGIIAVEPYDFDIIDGLYTPFDNLSLLVLMRAGGTFDKKVIASITESLAAERSRKEAFERLTEIIENPSLQMASFTITEKGYALKKPDGQYTDVIRREMDGGPEKATHTMTLVTGLLYKRYLKGALPLTLVSLDNCAHNGDRLKAAIIDIASVWIAKGFMEEEFLSYLKDEAKITFPLTMIDKITPRPAEAVAKILTEKGIEDMSPKVTGKGVSMAPFVNAEICDYLVIEDKFTNGRPRLEEAGVIFTDRRTVGKVETMKVTTCLNPLHTALAVSGSLLGFTTISAQVKDPDMKKLIHTIGYTEGLPVVVNPGIIDPKAFIDEVVGERFVNPYIPDTPQRIATDTSQKVGVRFGETIKAYVEREDLNPQDLTAIPLAIALWCRYLLAIDDEGQPFTPSPDPLLSTLQKELSGVTIGGDTLGGIRNILSNANLFGSDLYEAGLGNKIEEMFRAMIAEKGAVRKTLGYYL